VEGKMNEESRVGLLSSERQAQLRCFPSTFSMSWGSLKLYALAFAISFFTVVTSTMLTSYPGVHSALLVSGFSVSVLILLLGRMVHNEAKRDYEKAILEGKWQEGIFVFPTKDVVVRFNRPFVSVDQEFPAGSISLVQGNERNRIIYILWSDAQGHKLTFNVDCSRLNDPPAIIAAEMNRYLNIASQAPSEV